MVLANLLSSSDLNFSGHALSRSFVANNPSQLRSRGTLVAAGTYKSGASAEICHFFHSNTYSSALLVTREETRPSSVSLAAAAHGMRWNSHRLQVRTGGRTVRITAGASAGPSVERAERPSMYVDQAVHQWSHQRPQSHWPLPKHLCTGVHATVFGESFAEGAECRCQPATPQAFCCCCL